MKKTLLAGLAAGFLFTAVFSSAAWADSWYNGCKKKEQVLLSKIAYAERYGHHNQLSGLKQALREVQANCTEASISSKADSRVADKRAKVEERQRELDQAIRKGDKPDKIKKRQHKLDEAKAELDEAIKEHNSARR